MNEKINKVLCGREDNYIFPFFWQHGEEEEVLRKYMQVIAESNIGAVCVESRPHPDFAGEKWWKDMDVILDEARKRNMKVWILDDSHFPTGYANGALKDADHRLRRQSLTVQTVRCPESGSCMELSLKEYQCAADWQPNGIELQIAGSPKTFDDDRLLCVTAMKTGGKEDTDMEDLSVQIPSGKIVFRVPEGDWEIKICHLTRNRGPHREYINMMDEESCRVLLDAVYEPHYAHYGDDFGKTIAGFFSDEPEIGNGHLYEFGKKNYEIDDQPWSRETEKKLRELWKEKFHVYLPLLWTQDFSEKVCAQVRYDYMNTITELVKKNFSCQIGNWCRNHGVEYIGHLIEDNNQHSRTGSSLGHYFRGLAGQDMAGIDDIGGQVLPQGEEKGGNVFAPRDGYFYHYVLGKLASSAAAIEPLKKGRSMCEIFGAYGWEEGVQLEKFLLDHFLVRGINHYVPHAFSAKEFPDPDCPPHFYAHGHNPQYRHFGKLMKYANRMCELLSDGTHIAPVAILYQGESDWCSECMMMQEPARLLCESQIDFDFIPADAFAQREKFKTVIADKLQINTQSYQCLIIPDYRYLPEAAVQGIAEFLEKNGRVVYLDRYPEGSCEGGRFPEILKNGNCIKTEQLVAWLETEAVRDIKIVPKNRRVHYMHYRNNGDLYLVVNEDSESYRGKIYIPKKGSCYHYNAWDNCLERLDMEETDDGTVINAVIEPLRPLVLVFDEAEAPVKKPLQLSAGKTDISDGWIRSVCNSIDYPDFKEEKEVSLPDGLEEEKPFFSGLVRYEKTIISASEKLLLEISEASEGVEVFINEVSAGIQIAAPYRYDLSSLIRKGENRIRIEVATTLEREMSQIPNPLAALMGTDTTPICKSGITGKVYMEE